MEVNENVRFILRGNEFVYIYKEILEWESEANIGLAKIPSEKRKCGATPWLTLKRIILEFRCHNGNLLKRLF